jgi:hypothetical protein
MPTTVDRRALRAAGRVAREVGYQGEIDFTPRGGARRWPTRSRIGRIDILADRDLESYAPGCASAASTPEEETWGQLADHLLSKHVEPS